ncbi:MAG TPA: pre-peptidase C-terminal domain-containing protein [Thermotogota bacterium]|nr:pre-peptidase C-terminal domain-containing protein [Thermotogota bacterium]
MSRTRQWLNITLALLIPWILTGCFAFKTENPIPEKETTALVLIKHIVEGKVQSADGMEARVTTKSGWNTYPIRYDSVAITEKLLDIVSIQVEEAGTPRLSLKGIGSLGDHSEETAIIYEFFPRESETEGIRETVTPLQNDVAVTNLSGTQGQKRYYQIQVPAGSTQVTFQIYGGTGDADLYIRKGSLPTLSTFDARPYLYGNNETVTFNNPQPNTYYVMIHGYSAYNTLSLKAKVTGGSAPTTDISTLQNGVPISGISGSSGQERYYKIVLPSNASNLVFSLSGGSGDADLYTRKDALPTVSVYDYRPYLSGNNETATYNNPTAGTYYVMIRGYTNFSSVSLTGTYTTSAPPVDPGITTLSNNTPVSGISGARLSQKLYKIAVPADASALTIKMSGGSGDADLYTRKGSAPTLSSYDYRPYLSGNNEQVTYTSPAAGDYYIMIQGYAAYSGVSLLATYQTGTGGEDPTVVSLSDNVPVTNLSGATASQKYYRFDLSQNAASLEIAISGGTGDADLYVRKGALPTTGTYDYRPYLNGNNETVTITNPTPGVFYIMIRAYSSYSGVRLLAKTVASDPDPDPDPDPSDSSRKALLLGLTNYGGSGDLSYTDDDANDLKTVLTHLEEPFTVQTQTGYVTKTQILNGIASYASGSQSSDVFVFSYSGHGMYSSGQSYMYLSDGSNLSVSELKSALNAINGTKIVLIDACESGAFTAMVQGREVSAEERRLMREQIAEGFAREFLETSAERGSYQSPYEYYVLAACQTSEYSYEDSILKNGFFTFFFCDGMGHVGQNNPSGTFDSTYNADGYGAGGAVNQSITFQEIYLYAKDKVTSYSGGDQTVQSNHPSATYVLGTF